MKKKEILIFNQKKRNSIKKIKINTLSNSSDTYKRKYDYNYEESYEKEYYPNDVEIKNNKNIYINKKERKKLKKHSKLKSLKINDLQTEILENNNLDKLFNIILKNKNNNAFIDNLKNFAKEKSILSNKGKKIKKKKEKLKSKNSNKKKYSTKKIEHIKKSIFKKLNKKVNEEDQLMKKSFFLMPGLKEQPKSKKLLKSKFKNTQKERVLNSIKNNNKKIIKKKLGKKRNLSSVKKEQKHEFRNTADKKTEFFRSEEYEDKILQKSFFPLNYKKKEDLNDDQKKDFLNSKINNNEKKIKGFLNNSKKNYLNDLSEVISNKVNKNNLKEFLSDYKQKNINDNFNNILEEFSSDSMKNKIKDNLKNFSNNLREISDDSKIDINSSNTNDNNLEDIIVKNKKKNNLKLFLSDYKQNNIKDNLRNIIKIDFLSNWGSQKYIGINEIKIFDKNSKEIIIFSYNIRISKNKKEVYFPLDNIINNNIKTTDINNMLILPFDDKSFYSIEIEIFEKPSFLVIWNFNKDLSIGLKQCKIYFLNKKIFQGEILKGNGDILDESFFNIIKLSYNSQFSNIKKKIIEKYCSNKNRRNSSICRKKTSKSKVKEKSKEINKKEFENNIFLTQIKNNKLPLSNIEKKRVSLNLNIKQLQLGLRKEESKLKFNKISKKNEFYKNKKNKQKNNSLNLKKNIYSERLNKNTLKSDLLKKNSNRKNKKIQKIQSEIKIKKYFLPKLKGLSFNIINTWGDQNFSGLFRIEIFNRKGKIVKIGSYGVFDEKKNKIKTNLKVLIKKIVFTKSKNEHWLCPFKNNNKIFIKFKFLKEEEISMIRIWNYNTSRIDLTKGVKNLEITSFKNKKLIFSGIIKYASGSLKYYHHNYENILFTEDKKILKNITAHDNLFKYLNSEKKKISKIKIKKRFNDFLQMRPITVEKKLKFDRVQSLKRNFLNENKVITQNFNKKTKLKKKEKILVELKSIKLEIIENWGDKKEFGFSGIEFFDEDNNKIPIIFYDIKISNTNRKKHPLNIINRLKKLKPTFFNFKNKKSIVEYIFKEKMILKKINIFNINENYNLNKTGIKLINIFINKKKINKQIICINKGSTQKQKSLTSINFPITQPLNLIKNIKSNQKFYSGFTLKFHLKTTFGDPYYIGLNEIEIFDYKGINIIKEKKNKISAKPEGVFVLDRMADDKRRVENLKNGISVSDNYNNIWLAPLIKFKIQKRKNLIVIDFEKPFILGMINIWNYSKNFSRSVKEIDILLDDHLIFCGELNHPENESSLNSIIFCENSVNNLGPLVQVNEISKNKSDVIQLVDEGIIWQKSGKEEEIFHGYRPLTGLDPF